jgi:hypothetical protein
MAMQGTRMPRIRLLAAGAILLLGLSGSAMPLRAAAAQTAAEAEPGQPLQLVPRVSVRKVAPRAAASRVAASRLAASRVAVHRASARSAAARPKLSERRLSRRLGRTHVALAALAKRRSIRLVAHAHHRLLAHRDFVARQPEPVPPPATEVAAASPTIAAFVPPAAGEPTESEHAVRITSADTLNEIDLAASAPKPPADAATSAIAGTGSGGPPGVAKAAALSLAAASDGTEARSKPDAVVAFARRPRNEVGSTGWILQVMAALGGAVAAGSAAWFLIGSTPQRTFG